MISSKYKKSRMILEMNPHSSIPEYEMLRKEIFQYLEEYQIVRNMMYVVTFTILGLGENFIDSRYIFLAPLMVILPSFLINYVYMHCVVRAVTYLTVFYERDFPDSPYHWEERLREFEENSIKARITFNNKFHELPYYVCDFVCLIMFLRSSASFGSQVKAGEVTTQWKVTTLLKKFDILKFDILIPDLVIFLVLMGISIFVFSIFRYEKNIKDKYEKRWEAVRDGNCQDNVCSQSGKTED